jgi:hypothetical protein
LLRNACCLRGQIFETHVVVTRCASAKRELEPGQPTLAQSDHDHPQKDGVNKLGEAERPLGFWSPEPRNISAAPMAMKTQIQ